MVILTIIVRYLIVAIIVRCSTFIGSLEVPYGTL